MFLSSVAKLMAVGLSGIEKSKRESVESYARDVPLLSVETITDEADLRKLAMEWDALHEQVSPRLPFTTYLWASIWWQHYRREHLRAQDTLSVFSLRNCNGELIAVAPMILTRRPGYGPLSARELQFFGADTNVTELRGPLCRPEHTDAVVRSVSAFLDDANGADWVQWRGLRVQDGSLPAEIQRSPQLNTTVHILYIPSSWEEFRASLSRNMKEAIRKCYNSLARDKITFKLRIIDNPEDVPAAAERLFVLHTARSRDAAAAIKHPDVFASSVSRLFLTQYCTELAQRRDLKIFQLLVGDEVVASRIGFIFGDELYLYYSGYDPRWGRYSIMTTVVAEAIKWAIANKLRIVNLSTGTDISKTRWRPETIAYFGGFEIGEGYRSRALFDVVSRYRGRLLRGIISFLVAARQLPDILQTPLI